jgi:uncharacterized membrane protein
LAKKGHLVIENKGKSVMVNRIRKIVVGGVFSALVIVLGLSGLGFIPLPIGVAVTILQAPVIIAAVLEGPLVGFCTVLLFGIFSLVQASLVGGPIDIAFLRYPWLALIPRVCIGPAAWFIYSLISGSFFNKTQKISPVRESAAVSIAAVTGSLVNTALVLSGFLLLKIVSWPVAIGIISINGTLEAVFSAGISLAVILPWKGISRRGKSKLNSAEGGDSK